MQRKDSVLYAARLDVLFAAAIVCADNKMGLIHHFWRLGGPASFVWVQTVYNNSLARYNIYSNSLSQYNICYKRLYPDYPGISCNAMQDRTRQCVL